MHLVSCTNTHLDVTDLVNHSMVKNTKTWISWERSITFPQNKKLLNCASDNFWEEKIKNKYYFQMNVLPSRSLNSQ